MSAVRVTDHALVRFLERAGGIDVEALRDQLSAGLARGHAVARSIGDNDYLVKSQGLTFFVRGDAVVTVLDDPDPLSRARLLGEDGKR